MRGGLCAGSIVGQIVLSGSKCDAVKCERKSLFFNSPSQGNQAGSGSSTDRFMLAIIHSITRDQASSGSGEGRI